MIIEVVGIAALFATSVSLTVYYHNKIKREDTELQERIENCISEHSDNMTESMHALKKDCYKEIKELEEQVTELKLELKKNDQEFYDRFELIWERINDLDMRENKAEADIIIIKKDMIREFPLTTMMLYTDSNQDRS